MADLRLFSDASVNPQLKIGYGAYLAVPGDTPSLTSLQAEVKVKKFDATSSTRLELQTVLWALTDIKTPGNRIKVYTDSQNIVGLPARRDRLEKNAYLTKKNTFIRNVDLYKKFYTLIDQLDCEFIKIKGHAASLQKDALDRLFTLVDRASRQALRNGIK